MNKEIIANFEFNNERLLESLKATSAAVEALKYQQKELTAQGQMSSAQYLENKARLKELNAEMNEGLKIINNRNKAHRIDIENYSQEGKSIRELRKDSQDLIKVRNEMILNGEKNSEVFKRINEIVDANTEKIKQNVSAYEQQKMNIGNYSEGIVSVWEKIKSGDVKGAVGQIDELGEAWRGNAMTVGGAWKQIISIPVAGWIAGITAVIVMGFNQMIKYNEQVRILQKETAGITKLQGDMLRDATLQSSVIEQALGLDRLETLESAKALVNEFGISYTEALGMIEDGAIRGGAANKEYLESIREYPTFFANAGYSAQQFIDIVNAGYDLGIYNDKLPDALKEFDLSIKEQTKSTRDALINAFGGPFADELLKSVSTGKTTTKEALEEIARESDKYNLTQKQQAQLTSDIFRGAGEDAGGFVKIMAAVRKAAEDSNREYTTTERVLRNQVDAYGEMMEAKDKALRSDSIIAFRQEFEVAKLKIQTKWYELIGVFRQADKAIQISAGFVRGSFISIPKAAADAFAGVLSALAELLKGFRSGGHSISLFFKGEFEEAGAEFDKFTSSFPATLSKIKNSFKGFGKDIAVGAAAEAQRYGEQYDAKTAASAQIYKNNNPDKPTNDFDGTATPDKKKKGAKSGKTDKEKEAEKEAARLLKIAEANAKASVDLMKYQLDEYIKTNQSKIDSETFLTEQVLRIENERATEILNRRKAQLNAEMNLELSNKELTEAQKSAIIQKYQTERNDLDREAEEQRAENERTYADQRAERESFQRLVEHQTKLRDMEENHASELELKEEQLAFEFEQNEERKAIQKELDLIDAETTDAEVLERKATLEAALANIEAEYADARVEIAQAAEQQKLSTAADIAGGIAQIAGKQTAVGKAAAAAQAGINTYQGATLALANFPGPVGIAMAALTVASGIASVAKILGMNTGTAEQGFASLAQTAGNFKKSGKKAEKGIVLNGPSHAGGGLDLFDQFGNHLVNAEGGEMLAVVNKKSTLNYLSDLNVAGGGIPLTSYVKRAENGGMINTAISTATVDMSKQLADAVYQATLNGTYTGSQRGMKDLSSDRQVQLDATY